MHFADLCPTYTLNSRTSVHILRHNDSFDGHLELQRIATDMDHQRVALRLHLFHMPLSIDLYRLLIPTIHVEIAANRSYQNTLRRTSGKSLLHDELLFHLITSNVIISNLFNKNFQSFAFFQVLQI